MVDLLGFAHTPFARGMGKDVEQLMREVGGQALAEAQLDGKDIDAVVVSHFNHGMSPQGFTAGLAGGLLPGLHMVPSVRVEAACASGSAAVHQAAALVKSGEAQRVLVIGVEVMSLLPTAEVGRALLGAAYARQEAATPSGFAGMFAQLAEAYAQHFGDPHPAMALIAAKNHANGAHNPWAQMRQPLDADFCATESARNPRIVGRLLRSDCSPISDGAAALVVARRDARPAAAASVVLRASAQATDLMPMAERDMSQLAGARQAWRKLLARAECTLDDLDLVETHDCFTIAELMQYEAMGLTPPGEGRRALDEGWVRPGGRLPVNLSGGLKAKGHPIGATGVSMHVLAAWQLLGRWRSADVGRGRLAAVFNMGGAGVANFASLLERTR